MRMLPNCSTFLNRNVQTFGYVFHDVNGQNSLANIEDPVAPLERNLYGHPSAGLPWEKTIRRSFIGTWMGESTDLGMHVRSSGTRLFLSEDVWIASKWLEMSINMAPM